MKATDNFFPVVLFILLYKVVLTFNSVFEILKCDHSNESDRAVLSCGVVQDYSSSKFFVILSYAWQSSLPVETHRVQHRNSYLYPPQLSARAVVCQTPLLPFPLACFSNRMNSDIPVSIYSFSGIFSHILESPCRWNSPPHVARALGRPIPSHPETLAPPRFPPDREMSRNARDSMHTDYNKNHEVSPRPRFPVHHHILCDTENKTNDKNMGMCMYLRLFRHIFPKQREKPLVWTSIPKSTTF